MSTLLERAIIDAKALKETAEKQAQKSILEKYQEEIKSVYDSMLEQEIDPLHDFASEESAEREDPSLDFEDDLDMTGDDSLAPQMPYAHEEGENLCPCPEEDEEIEIDFDKLAAMLSGEQPEQPSHGDDMLSGLGGGDEDMEDFANLKLEETGEHPACTCGTRDMIHTGNCPLASGTLRVDQQRRKEESNKFSFQSKAQGNSPEDRMKNVSPQVKDKDVKRPPKDDVVDVEEGFFDRFRKKEKGPQTDYADFKKASREITSRYNIQVSTKNISRNPNIIAMTVDGNPIVYFLHPDDNSDKLLVGTDPQSISSSSNSINFNKEEIGKAVLTVMKKMQQQGGFSNKNTIDEADSELCEKCYEVHAPGHCPDKDMKEKVIYDDKGNKSGWTARPTDVLAHELDKNETDEMYDKDDSEAFKDADYKKDLEDKETEYDDLKENTKQLKEKFKEIYKENLNLKEQNNSYTMKVAQLTEKNSKFMSLLVRAQEELEKTHLQSTKLFYENKVFRNASLNERQKSNIVEAISEINTAEQVRPIYEALLKNKGTISSNKKGSPKSLRETVSKRSSVTRLAVSSESRTEPQEQSTNLNNVLMERMQKLAGIKKE